jgi:hypothetical protein
MNAITAVLIVWNANMKSAANVMNAVVEVVAAGMECMKSNGSIVNTACEPRINPNCQGLKDSWRRYA